MDIAFLLMWGMLEKITDTVGANYGETINRTVWILPKHRRPMAKDILESLRYRCNQYVHYGKTTESGDQIAYLIKSFVDPHLLRLLFNSFKIHSLEEYGKLLALPVDIATLEKQQRMIVQAW